MTKRTSSVPIMLVIEQNRLDPNRYLRSVVTVWNSSLKSPTALVNLSVHVRRYVYSCDIVQDKNTSVNGIEVVIRGSHIHVSAC